MKKKELEIGQKGKYKHLAHYVTDEDHLKFYAFPDELYQYAIPVTFILNNSNSELDTNRLITEINGESVDIFKEINFDVDHSSDIVIANVSKDFSFGEGSAEAYMFTEALSYSVLYPSALY